MGDVKLEDIRAAITSCSFIKEGSTQESRQRANRERINLHAKLDECGSKLDELREVASRENKSTTEIEVKAAALCGVNSAVRVIISHAPLPLQYMRSVGGALGTRRNFFSATVSRCFSFLSVCVCYCCCLCVVNGDPENASLTALAGLPLTLVVREDAFMGLAVRRGGTGNPKVRTLACSRTYTLLSLAGS